MNDEYVLAGDDAIETPLCGLELLNTPLLNKGDGVHGVRARRVSPAWPSAAAYRYP
jgi:hypothetical protein